ncbi:MAG: hypothetical protein GY925_01050, partial [Actinomycetia bacterium]|nr:hypothetical protein [Actinomycetes bacterium]
MPRGVRATDHQIRKYHELRAQGLSRKVAANTVGGFTYNWGERQDKIAKDPDAAYNGATYARANKLKAEGEADAGVRNVDDLCVEARAALEDLEAFALRYFGVKLLPWQIESADQIIRLLDTPHKEYLVVNCPPGAGKSKFFTNILPAWLTMRNRSLRGMIGSATISLAKNFVDHLRQEFEREVPVAATPQEIKNEMGFDAESTLAFDYGRVKPSSSGVRWTATEFFVEQDAKYMAAAKEPTWSALGRGTAFLGYRVDFAIWDDAWDPNSMKTAESREEFFRWWDGVAESRLEPGGLLVIVMQRLGPDDLSAHALGKQLGALDYALDEDEDNVELEGRTEEDSPPDGRKYWHIKYKAYYQDMDTGPKSRRPSSPPYPAGPLLTPRRIPWNECRDHMHNKPDMWETMYQQEDVASASVLVKKVWISGGTDPDTGEHHPGCWDEDRPSGLVPKNWERPLVSIATVDPSPVKWWAIQWWVYQPETNRRFLIDLVRDKMGANDFLDYNADTRMFTGIMQEWQTRSVEQDCPIQFWVVERNAAQRFMLQYNHTHNWIREWGTSIIEHNTSGENKNSIEFGVQTIASKYRHGQVRLPGLSSDNSRLTSLKLVDEVTRYPGGGSDDQVMAHWFFEYRLGELEQIPNTDEMPKLQRPGW